MDGEEEENIYTEIDEAYINAEKESGSTKISLENKKL